MKYKLIKIISKSIALAVVISFFSTYFYVVWNYYDPVQKKLIEPIKKTSYNVALADNSYMGDIIYYYDSNGYTKVQFKALQNFSISYRTWSSGWCTANYDTDYGTSNYGSDSNIMMSLIDESYIDAGYMMTCPSVNNTPVAFNFVQDTIYTGYAMHYYNLCDLSSAGGCLLNETDYLWNYLKVPSFMGDNTEYEIQDEPSGEPEPPEYTTDVSISFFDYMVRILPYYDPSDDKTYLINTTDSVIKYKYNFLDEYTIKVYENSSVIFNKVPFTDFDTDDSGILTIPIEIDNSESYTLKVEVYDENDALISFLTDVFDVLGVDGYEIPDQTETPNYTGIWGDIQNFVSYIFKWLFVPSTSVINQWKTLSTDIKTHFPASLWYDIIGLFKFDTYEKKTLGTFKTPAGILGPNEVELVSLQPTEEMQNSEFWTNMKKLMAVALWFMVIIYIISKFTDKENL